MQRTQKAAPLICGVILLEKAKEMLKKFELTKSQTEYLQELFDMIPDYSEDDKLPMVIGQFIEAKKGVAFAIAGYVGHEKALQINKIMGGTGKSIKPVITNVFVPHENKTAI